MTGQDKWISDHLVRKPDEQEPHASLSDTKYTLGHLSHMSKIELIEEILGTHTWEYLLENELVRVAPRFGGMKLVEVNNYLYTVFPHEGIFSAVLEYNYEESEYVLQTYGEDRKKWEEDGFSTFCFLYAVDSIEE